MDIETKVIAPPIVLKNFNIEKETKKKIHEIQ